MLKPATNQRSEFASIADYPADNYGRQLTQFLSETLYYEKNYNIHLPSILIIIICAK